MSVHKKACAVLLILATAASLTFTGCGARASAKTPEPSAITSGLRSQLSFPEMVEVGGGDLGRYYQLPSGAVKQASVYVCSSSASADEIAVFEAGSVSDAQKIYEAAQHRKEQKASVYRDYGSPQQYSNIQHCVLETQGNYILFAVTDDSSKAHRIISTYF